MPSSGVGDQCTWYVDLLHLVKCMCVAGCTANTWSREFDALFWDNLLSHSHFFLIPALKLITYQSENKIFETKFKKKNRKFHGSGRTHRLNHSTKNSRTNCSLFSNQSKEEEGKKKLTIIFSSTFQRRRLIVKHFNIFLMTSVSVWNDEPRVTEETTKMEFK